MLPVLKVDLARFCPVNQGGSEVIVPSSVFFGFLLVWDRAGLASFSHSCTLLVFILLILFRVLWEENYGGYGYKRQFLSCYKLERVPKGNGNTMIYA